MSQCVTSPTLTLFGTTVIGGSDPTPVYSTSTRYATIAGKDSEVETSTCDGGFKGGVTDPGACSHYSTYTVTISGTPTYQTFEDVYVTTVGGSRPITSTFPTATQYTTSCTDNKPDAPSSQPGTPTTPIISPTSAPGSQTTTTRPAPDVVVVPSVGVSVGVSSNPVSVTDAQGRLSISVQIVSVSATFTSNVAVQSGLTNLATTSSSSSIGPIIGGVVGGLAFLGAIVALFLIRKRRNRNRDDRDDDDDGYGTVRRSEDRVEKVERKRMDLSEDVIPGVVEPFTYTDTPASAPTGSYQPQPQPGQNAYAPVRPTSPGLAADAAYAGSSSHSHSSGPAMTPAQSKALEAHRSRSGQGGSSSAGGPSFASPVGSPMEEEEIVVHQDAGPARVELPPVYVDRAE